MSRIAGEHDDAAPGRSDPKKGKPTGDPSVTLARRPLTPSEALRLHEELRTTANILGYTVRELLRFRDVLVAQVEGELAGVCISKDLRFGWTDIALLYLLPGFRGRGIGRDLYTAAFRSAQERGRHLFTLSRSPEVIHLMEHLGMKLTPSVWRVPLAVHLHMSRHMMSRYRIGESLRKAKRIKGSPPLVAGTWRSEPRRLR